MRNKFYKIIKTPEYNNALFVYNRIKKDNQLVSSFFNSIDKSLMMAIKFNEDVISKIDKFVDKFFNTNENGMSCFLSEYLNSLEYDTIEKIENLQSMINGLHRIYNKEKFPNEYQIIVELLDIITTTLYQYKIFEKDYPDFFEK